MKQEFSDEQLMAYADGELEPLQASEIETALAEDELLTDRLALFIESRAGAALAMDPLLKEPVPANLQASIEAMIADSEADQADRSATTNPPNVVAFPTRLRRLLPSYEMAAAASIALIVGGVVGFSLSGTTNSPDNVVIASSLTALSRADVVAAMTSVASGDEIALEDGSRFRAIASFEDENDNLCREVEIDSLDVSTVVAVACAENAIWNIRFTVVAASVENGYAPASSLEALDAYLQAVGAGDPLSDEAEQSALALLRN